MDNDMKEILATFYQELTEHIQSANDCILNYEESTDPERINELFRALHTIKGNSMMLGFEKLGAIAHAAESVAAKLRNDTLAPSKQLMDLFLATLDSIADSARALRDGQPEPDGTGKLIDVLNRVAQGQTSPQNSMIDAPAPKPVQPEVSSKAETSSKAESSSKADNTGTPTTRTDFTMLVVDDDFISRKIITNMLKRYGTCDIAKDGAEAIEAFRQASSEQPYDFVFLDIMLPGIDGFEVARQIRSIEMVAAMSEIRDKAAHERRFHRHDAVVVMTSSLDDPESYFNACYRCGA
ncbi:MAG: Hpt domain-containing protein, partial [Spirochaetales bacterium]|nr:Hpt domain-containing protein [Spirochaetales bacterium]